MINKVGDITFKEIKRISPSQFYSMKNCAYKSLLAEAFDKKPLLPLSPNAYFGTVLHKILELIAKGIIKNDGDFNIEFDRQVKIIEDDLQEKGFDFFVPLQKKLKNFGLKKIQLKKHLRGELQKQTNLSNIKFSSEKWFESKDKMIGGKVDLIIEHNCKTEIIDFKTGAITEDFLDDEGEIYSDIKNEYKEQLKLYAYLYFENTNKLPTRLSLVDLANQKFSVDFTEKECMTVYEEAKSLFKRTNECINLNEFSATPNETNCKYCLYRPACAFFQAKLETDFTYNDIVGEIKEVKKFQNGNVSLFLQNKQNILTIKNLSSEKFDELNKYRNKKIIVFNLKRDTTEGVYSTTYTTMIYHG